MPPARRSITPLNDRVIAFELQELERVPRVIGIAGGKRKTAAIRGALQGRWINILITDRSTAERLVRGVTDSKQDRQAIAGSTATRRRA